MLENVKTFIEIDEMELPSYSSLEAAGCDVRANADVVILPGETKIVPTGFKLAIEPGYEVQVRPRSGLSLKTWLRIPNSPGTIDSDYRHECGVIVQNQFTSATLQDLLLRKPELAQELDAKYQAVDLLNFYQKRGWSTESLQKLLVENPSLNTNKVYLDAKGNPFGTLYIERGERIAQMVLCKVERMEFVQHEDVSKIGNNRGGGYGSTGVK